MTTTTNPLQFATRVVLFGLCSSVWIAVQMPILKPMIRYKLGAVIPISLGVVLLLRFLRGGTREVKRELRTFATDLSFPGWYLVDTYKTSATINTADWMQELLNRLSILSKYLVMYGPISIGGALILVLPFVMLLQPMMKEAWFLEHSLQWIGLVIGSMLFFGVATNACQHRFFSHGSFKASRMTTFCLGAMGCLGGQFGPLWWASNHRRHHKYCETELDVHSPPIHGFWYAHCGWFMDADNFPIRAEYLPAVGKKYPELMILDVFSTNILIVCLYGAARWVEKMITVPAEANTPGFLFALVLFPPKESVPIWEIDFDGCYVDSALLLGFCLFLHFEFFTNSWCHTWTRKEKTDDSPCEGLDSYWVGILNGGEGFHKNHHQFPVAAQHGPQWYYDASYMFICGLETLGLAWDVAPKKHA